MTGTLQISKVVYEIKKHNILNAERDCLAWVEVDDKEIYDDCLICFLVYKKYTHNFKQMTSYI